MSFILVPVRLMSSVSKLFDKGVVVNRLFDSLQVDSSKAGNLLREQPLITMDHS